MTADSSSEAAVQIRRRQLLTATAALAVVAGGVGPVVWSELTGAALPVMSTSAVPRNVGLAVTVLKLPAALVAATYLSALTSRSRWNPWVRASVHTWVWGTALVFVAHWAAISYLQLAISVVAAEEGRAEQQVAELPGRIEAVPGVIATRDEQLQWAGVDDGRAFFIIADVDPDLPAGERLATLDRQSAVLAAHSVPGPRPFIEARMGDLAVGVSSHQEHNRYRLDLAERVSAATAADLTVVLWRLDYRPIEDDGREVRVLVRSASFAPEGMAAAAEPVVRGLAGQGTIVASRHRQGQPCPPST